MARNPQEEKWNISHYDVKYEQKYLGRSNVDFTVFTDFVKRVWWFGMFKDRNIYYF